MATLREAREAALDRVHAEQERRLNLGATIQTTTGAAVVAIDKESQSDWDVLDRRAADFTFPFALEDAAGVVRYLQDEAAAHAAADVILATVQAHRVAAMNARSAVRGALTVEAVTAALAAYLGS